MMNIMYNIDDMRHKLLFLMLIPILLSSCSKEASFERKMVKNKYYTYTSSAQTINYLHFKGKKSFDYYNNHYGESYLVIPDDESSRVNVPIEEYKDKKYSYVMTYSYTYYTHGDLIYIAKTSHSDTIIIYKMDDCFDSFNIQKYFAYRGGTFVEVFGTNNEMNKEFLEARRSYGYSGSYQHPELNDGIIDVGLGLEANPDYIIPESEGL